MAPNIGLTVFLFRFYCLLSFRGELGCCQIIFVSGGIRDPKDLKNTALKGQKSVTLTYFSFLNSDLKGFVMIPNAFESKI